MRLSPPLLALAFVLLAAAPARADGDALGRVPNVITVEGLAGFVQIHEAPPSGDAESSTLFGTLGSTDLRVPLMRLGYHRLLGALSLGGNVFWGTASNQSHLALAPRIGGVFPIGATTAIWPRAGITYGRLASPLGSDRQTAVGGELLFAFTPVSHFGVLLGPFVELPMSASYTRTTVQGQESSGDGIKSRYIGVSVGLLADF